MSLTRINTTSKLYTGDVSFPADTSRGYLFIYVVSGSYTVAFGGGTGEIPLPVASAYEPIVCPTSDFTLTANDPADTVIVHSDQQVEV